MSTFGKTTDGGSSSASSADRMYVSKFTPSSSGVAQSGSIRAWLSATGSTPAKFVIFADSSGEPGALLAVSDELAITNTSEALLTFTFTGANVVNITSGTAYWIGLAWKDPGTPSLNISRDATATSRRDQSIVYPTIPNPFGTAAASNSGPIDAYVTYVTPITAAVSLSVTPTLTVAGTAITGAQTHPAAVSLSAGATLNSEGSIGQVNISQGPTITIGGTITSAQSADVFTTSNAREMATYAIVLEGTGDIRQGAISLTVSTSLLSGQIVGAGAIVATATATLEATLKQIIPVFPISGMFTLTGADNTAAYIITLESLAVEYPGQVSMVATPTIEITEYKVQGAVSLVAIPTITLKSENFGSALLTQTPTILIIPFVNERFAKVVNATLTIQGPLYKAQANVSLTAVVAFRVAAQRQKAPIFRTNYPYPPVPHGFRVIAQKILTGEIIDWELPVADDFEYTIQLSGPTVMKGSFKPEITSVQELNLDGYAVMFHVEIDGQIRASGIMLPPQYAESSLDFTCEGVAAVPHYVMWDSSFSGLNVDAFDIVRMIWTQVQNVPTSNLGVQLPTTLAGRTFGTPAGIEIIDAAGNVIQTVYEPPRIKAARSILARLSSVDPHLLINEDWSWAEMGQEVSDWHTNLHDDFLANPLPIPVDGDPTGPNDQTWLTKLIADYMTSILPEGAKTRDRSAEPYELQWWNGTNCGEEFDKLAGDTPFDYAERVGWNEDKTDVNFGLQLGYPRLGTQRPDLIFNEDNLLEVVPAQEGEDTYASAVLVVGAGEGAATIRGYASQNFGERIRKTVVYTDKSITTQDRANKTALAELGVRRGKTFEITELVVAANHLNAPMGSYDVGDDIVAEVFVPWLSELHRDWYRITSITYQPNREHVRLGVQRSDSFRYPVAA